MVFSSAGGGEAQLPPPGAAEACGISPMMPCPAAAARGDGFPIDPSSPLARVPVPPPLSAGLAVWVACGFTVSLPSSAGAALRAIESHAPHAAARTHTTTAARTGAPLPSTLLMASSLGGTSLRAYRVHSTNVPKE